MRMTKMINNELDLLKKAQNGDKYGEKLIEDVRDVMNMILKQGHSGMSIGFLKNIVNRCIDGKCLTPLTGADDEWEKECKLRGESYYYQNKRMPSVFKNSDGKITDVNRAVYIDKTDNITCTSSITSNLVDEMFPITFPYMPSDEPYTFYGTSEYEKDDTGIGYHTICEKIEYVITPEGNRIEINKEYRFEERPQCSRG